ASAASATGRSRSRAPPSRAGRGRSPSRRGRARRGPSSPAARAAGGRGRRSGPSSRTRSWRAGAIAPCGGCLASVGIGRTGQDSGRRAAGPAMALVRGLGACVGGSVLRGRRLRGLGAGAVGGALFAARARAGRGRAALGLLVRRGGLLVGLGAVVGLVEAGAL